MWSITLLTAHDNAVGAEGPDQEYALRGNRHVVGGWEIFKCIPVAGGMALQTAHGKYVCACPPQEDWVLKGNRDTVGPWETFLPEMHGDLVALRTAHGRYVAAESADKGWLLRGDRTVVGGWEQFDICEGEPNVIVGRNLQVLSDLPQVQSGPVGMLKRLGPIVFQIVIKNMHSDTPQNQKDYNHGGADGSPGGYNGDVDHSPNNTASSSPINPHHI